MNEPKKISLEEISATRNACLRHAESLHGAALRLLDAANAPFAYHLATLALEEVGKAELQLVKPWGRADEHAEDEVGDRETDHREKLTWAIFTARGGGLPRPADIREARELGEQMHVNRMRAVYSEMDAQLGRSPITLEQATSQLRLVDLRIKMARAKTLVEPSAEDRQALDWLIENLQDDHFKQFIARAAERGASDVSAKDAIAAVREEWERYLAANRDLAARELSRSPDELRGDQTAKWQFDVRFESGYHLISPKVLSKCVFASTFVQLLPVGRDRKVLNARFKLPRAIPLAAVYEVGHTFARTLLLALNIGSFGLFGWRVSPHPTRFFEKLEDLESNATLVLEKRTKGDLDPDKHPTTLSEEDLRRVAICFGYLLRFVQPGTRLPLENYELGVAALVMNDVNTYTAPGAFMYLFKAMKDALHEFGGWDGKDIQAEVAKHFGEGVPDKDEQAELLSHVRDAEAGRVRADIGVKFSNFLKAICDVTLFKGMRERAALGLKEARDETGGVRPEKVEIATKGSEE